MNDAAITRDVARGRLHPIFRGVFAVGCRRDDSESRMLAAVLACGRGAGVSHGSAAALLGLQDREPVSVDVISPGRSGWKVDGIRRHNVPLPVAAEITKVGPIPCACASRVIVDLAGQSGERRLRRLIERAAFLDLLDLEEIDAVMTRRGRFRGSPMLRRILVDWRSAPVKPRLRSPLEARLLPLIAAAGLSAPLCNQQVEGLEVDLYWPRQRLVVECDGGPAHGHPVAFERDHRRDLDLKLAGYEVIRLTWKQLDDDAGKAMALIARALMEADPLPVRFMSG